jgi:hypothetical protein
MQGIMTNFILWDKRPCSPLKIQKQARNKLKSELHDCLLSASWLLGLFSYPENGGHSFLRNVGCLSTVYKALYPRRENSPLLPLWEPQILHCYYEICRSHWTRGWKHEMSSPAETQGSWVRVPLKAWISVFILCLCVGSGVATGWSHVIDSCQQSYIMKVKWSEAFHGCPVLQVEQQE